MKFPVRFGNVAGEIVSLQVEEFKLGELGQTLGEIAGEVIFGKVEVGEVFAGGNVGGDCGIDGIVEKGEEFKFGEVAAEEGRKRAGDIGVVEVKRSDGIRGGVANDAVPGTGSGVEVIPIGERVIRVGKGGFELEEEEAFWVEGMGEEREGKGED